jgi:hypothetical protein
VGDSRRPPFLLFALGSLTALAIAVLVFFIYASALRGPFVFDDRQILENPSLRLTELSMESVARAASEGTNRSRFVANLSFALNYYFHEFDVFWFRLVNILIHFASGLLLYHLVKTTLALPTLRGWIARHREVAFFATLLWLVHPIAPQSVAYVVQRMNSMASMFYVLSLLLYVRARLAASGRTRWILFAGCAISAVLALGSKETAATLPVFIFIYEWYFLQDLRWDWLKRKAIPLAGLMGLSLGIAVAFLGRNPLDRILSGYGQRDFTLVERVLTEFRVVIHYIGIILFPHPSRLSLNHDFPLSDSLLSPITTLLSMGLIALMSGVAVYTARNHRLVSFCIVWFLGNLVIESSIIPLEIIFEHRTYLPAMFGLALLVTLVYRYLPWPWVRIALLSAGVIVCSVWAQERSKVWADDLTLWGDIVEKQPTLARGHLGLGVVLKQRGEQEKAFESYKKAVDLDPQYADAYNNLGVIYEERGQLDLAMLNYEKAYSIDKAHLLALNNVASIHTLQGNFERAIDTYQQSLRINPRYADTYKGLALTYRAMKDEARFNEFLEKARALEGGR